MSSSTSNISSDTISRDEILMDGKKREFVLVVDDEPSVRDVLARHLERRGFIPIKAGSGNEALQILESALPMAVISDVQMPGMNGLDLLQRVLRVDPDISVILITGVPSVSMTIEALRAGASDFLPKPIDFRQLVESVQRGLERRTARLASRRYQMLLEEQVNARTSELTEALERLRTTNDQLAGSYRESIELLRRASAYRDDETGYHIDRIRVFSAEVARAMGLAEDQVEVLAMAAPMHDIGKIGIPDEILRKPGKLTPAEYEIIKKHTTIGAQILANQETPLLKASEIIALTHHERWDGTGYPRGLVGEDIPLFGRIVSVVDVWDALTHERCYKPAFSTDKAIQIIREGRGTQFDPAVVDAFMKVVDKLREIDKGHVAAGVGTRE